MSVSIQQENVFQQLLTPLRKHRGLDKGGGTLDWGLEVFTRANSIFSFKAGFLFLCCFFLFFPFFFKPCVKIFPQKSEKSDYCKDPSFRGLLERHLSLGVMVVFFCIRGDGCLPSHFP